MKKAEIETICSDRLSQWAQDLVKEHATPAVLVGIGHDLQEGKLVICTTEQMTNDEIAMLLLGAIKEL